MLVDATLVESIAARTDRLYLICEWNLDGTCAGISTTSDIKRRLCLHRFYKGILSSSWNKTTREDVSVRERCERGRDKRVREKDSEGEGKRVRALTVIETALASPLVSWVAGSVPACQPVCHHHCLVFSLRPSACSLYTGSCSGLTCFLYIDIFIAAQTSPFPPPPWRRGGQ